MKNSSIEGRLHSLQAKNQFQKERRSLLFRRYLSNRSVVIGSVIILLLVLISVFAVFIAKYAPDQMEVVNRLKPPSPAHYFGTDNFGRDLFSRIIYGTRVSMIVGLSVALITMITGTVIGLYSAYYRILDHILMRICDGLMAFPAILLAIALMAALRPSLWNVILSLSIVNTPTVARTVRSAAMVVKEQTYIEALKSQGAGSLRIIWKHVAPNTMSPLIVQVTYVFGVSIFIEAALSFLGAGIPAPAPSLGNILLDGKIVIYSAWWMTVFPSIFIIFAVLGLNLFGDGLRDLLDPHTNKAKK
ncbi:ABC transporter permease [Paenibacillus sp. GP183]|uniref:ABC transporter permease n=1 Tax=Paenibacillus sp. GP183 TaxID=1882751 RepID=UPI00209BAB10|nr:ABC transporter permease [Paenibacillus sp. GP183]